MTVSGACTFEPGDSIPTEDTRSSAAQLREILIAHENGEEIIVLGEDNQRQPLVLVPQISNLLCDILGYIEKGEWVTFVPNSKHLTTQQAADILNVSRPFLIKLLEQGQLAHSKVGRHRRIEAAHLFAYKRKRDAERDATLDDLIGKDQELY